MEVSRVSVDSPLWIYLTHQVRGVVALSGQMVYCTRWGDYNVCKRSVGGFEQFNVFPAEGLLQLKGVSLWGHVLQCGKRPVLFGLFGCQKSLIVENSVVQICSLL